MYFRIIINLVLVLVLIAFQSSFLNLLPIVSYLNLLLVISLFVLVMNDLDWAIVWFLLIAFCLDVFSFNAFGIHLMTLGLVLIISYVLLINFFTNRSLYSFLFLVGIATIIYDASLLFVDYLYISSTLFVLPNDFWLDELWRLLANLIATGIIFYILNLFSKRFQPVFLRKKIFR